MTDIPTEPVGTRPAVPYPDLPPSRMPQRKVAAGTLAGALAALVVWGLDAFAGVRMSGESAAALVTVLSFAVAYMVPSEKAA